MTSNIAIFSRFLHFMAQKANMLFFLVDFSPRVLLKRTIFLLILISVPISYSQLFLSNKAQAANSCTWTGAADSNWSNAANWSGCGGVAPTAADTVSFTSGSNASTVDTTYTVAAMSVSGYTGTITLQADLTINGNLSTVSGTIDCGASPNYTLTVAGSGVATLAAGATINNGTIVAYSMLTQGATFNGVTNLTKNGAGVNSWSGGGGNTFNGQTTITNSAGSGYLIINSLNSTTDRYNADVTFINNSSVNRIYAAHSNCTSIFYGNVTSTIGNGAQLNNLTFSTDSTANFAGAGTQTLSGGWYNITNLNHTGSGTLQITSNTPTIAALSNDAGTLDANGYNITATTFTNNAVLKLEGNETISTPTNNSGSLVQYYGISGPYNIKAWTYYNLQLSSSLSTTYFLTAALTVNGDLAIDSNNTLDTSGSSFSVAVTGNITIGGTLNGNASSVTSEGNWDSSGGIYNYGTSTVAMTGISKTIVTTASGNPWTPRFYNLTIGANGQNPQASITAQTASPVSGFMVTNALIIWGTLTVSGSPYNTIIVQNTGTLNIQAGGVLTGGGQLWRDLSNASTPIINNGTISVGLFTYSPSSATTTVQVTATAYGPLLFKENGASSTIVVGTGFGQTLTATNLTIQSTNAGHTTTLDNQVNNANINCANLVVGNSGNLDRYGVFKAGAGIVSASGNVIIYASDGASGNHNLIDAGASAWNVSGNLTNSDAFAAGTSLVTFTGSGTQTFSAGSSSFNNVSHSGTGTLQLLAALTVNSSLANSAGTFDSNGNAVTVAGLSTVSGGTYLASTNTQTFNGGLTVSGGSFTGNSGTVNATNVILSSGALTAPSGAFNVSGNWTNSGGIFYPGTYTVYLTAPSGTQTLDPGGSSFYNLYSVAGGTRTVLLASNLQTIGFIWLSGGIFDANGKNVTSGTDLGVDGATYYSRTGTTAISGNLYVYSWYIMSNFTAGTGSVSVAKDVDLYNYLGGGQSNGTFTAPSTTLTVGGNWNQTAGTFVHDSGEVIFNSSATGNTIGSVMTGSNAFDNLTFIGSGAWAFSNPVDITGSLNITDGTVDTDSMALNVGLDLTIGDSTHTGVLNAGASTITLGGGNRGVWIQSASSALNSTGTILCNASSGIQWLYSVTGAMSLDNISHTGGSTLQPYGTNLSLNGALASSAGTFDANGNAITVAGLTTVSGGTYLSSTNTQTFNGGLVISGGTFSGSTGAVNVTGDLNISSGIFMAPSGTLAITGNFANDGTFNHNSGTVIFNGAGTSVITGSANAPNFAVTFYNLATSAGKTLKFGNGKYFKDLNSMALNGTSANHVTVTSDDGLNKWYINHQGTQTISYVNLDHSGCDYTNSPNTNSINMAGTNSTDNGNNDNCWVFGSNQTPNLPSSLTQQTSAGVGIPESAHEADNMPHLGFTISDPDAGDTVKYEVQVANNSTFSAPIIDYTQGSFSVNPTTFTFSIGNYGNGTCAGSCPATLSDMTGYWWRVKAIDNHSASSNWVEFGVPGTMDFYVDSTALIGGNLNLSSITVSDFPNVMLSGSATNATTTMNPFTVTDARGTGAGWNVTVQATQFKEYVGGIYVNGGKTLSLSSLSMASPTVAPNGTSSPAPTILAGPYIIDSGSAVKIASAAVGNGMGAYDFTPGASDLTLNIPANAYATAYRSEVTVSVVSGP